jgi:WD40-like Beta Propeller Repeat
VIPTPDYRCDDGSEPQTMDGPPLNEQLRNLTYTRDASTDTLSVGIGDVWLREGAEAPSPAPQPSEQVAPPSAPVAPTATAQPSVDPGRLEPIADRIVCGNHNGEWSYPATTVQLTSEVLGCSMEGTRVLIQKGNENLFVLHADGSETQVTEQLSGFDSIPGSARPTGATISPDGSRIVFAGLTKPWQGNSCHDGALFAVDADGGPAEVLWKSQRDGIVRDPMFSPDGTQIAFVDGSCDSDHSVWVMNADGSDAHQIMSSDIGPLGATHVHGLAWSAAGDQIALKVDDGTWTFATDGSGVTQGAASEFCWPGREC